MMEIQVRPSGGLQVLDYRIDGNLCRSREFASWAKLMEQWGKAWSIDIRRTVFVRPEFEASTQAQMAMGGMEPPERPPEAES